MSCAVHVQNITISRWYFENHFSFSVMMLIGTNIHTHHTNHKSKNQFDSFQEFKIRDSERINNEYEICTKKAKKIFKKKHTHHILTHTISLEISQSKWLKCFQFVHSIERWNEMEEEEKKPSYVIYISIIETFFSQKITSVNIN